MPAPFSGLIVDDTFSLATAVADILLGKGYQAYVAGSGAEDLQVLQEHPVDVMLTDVKMPDMDGLTILPPHPPGLAAPHHHPDDRLLRR